MHVIIKIFGYSLPDCEHEWMIDESHPQIVAELEHGTSRINKCMKCGVSKGTGDSEIYIPFQLPT